jgi:hypothetical protein
MSWDSSVSEVMGCELFDQDLIPRRDFSLCCCLQQHSVAHTASLQWVLVIFFPEYEIDHSP